MRLNRTSICIVAAGAYLVLRLSVSWMKPAMVEPGVAILIYTAVLMLAQLGVVVTFAGLRLSLKRVLFVLGPCLVVVCGMTLLEARIGSVKPLPVAALVWTSILRDLCLMFFSASLGYAVSFIIRAPNILLPAAVFAGFVDYWNVHFGLLSRVIVEKPSIVSTMSVSMPAPGTGVPMVTVGMGDFVFLALFFGVLYRFGLNVRGAFWLGYVLLTVSMLIVIRWAGPLPALVPMGLAIVAANIRRFKLNREELLATVYVAGILLVFLAASAVFLFE